MKKYLIKGFIGTAILTVLMVTTEGISVAQTTRAHDASIGQTTGFQQPHNIPVIQLVPLTVPMSFGALQILLTEADSLYRSERLIQAHDTIIGLLELEPNFAPAWLRLGNIWQTQGKTSWALEAYRLAAQSELQMNSPIETRVHAEAKLKALLNLSSLHLNQARNSQLKIEGLQNYSPNLFQTARNQETELEALETEQRRLLARTTKIFELPQSLLVRTR
jgi:tetratricopeptide (TPR) repeat protein